MNERVAFARVAFANVGGEEDGDAAQRFPPAARLARAWTSLVEDPPWPWLQRAVGLVPWLSTNAAALAAKSRGMPLWGARDDVVLRVHDKGWTARTARALGLDPELSALVTVIDAPSTKAAIESAASTWPAWARASFTVKPRWGTSGRGRLKGIDGVVEDQAVPLSGVVVEPWLQRVLDTSSLWFIDDDGTVDLVGTTLQAVRAGGIYLGCDVVVRDGALVAGTAWDLRVVEVGRALVEAASADGLRGPCGVDAFVYRHPEGGEVLRGAVELNARFTAGHVALGLAARAGLLEGARYRFRLDSDEVLARGS